MLTMSTAMQLRPGTSAKAFAAGRRLVPQSSRAIASRSSSRGNVVTGGPSLVSTQEVFFVGRAMAEVLSERLGAAVGDALADFGRLDAETRQAMREFQEDVMARVQREMAASAGDGSSIASDGTSTTLGGAAAPPPDLPALVDDLRAEVASARAVLQQLKLKQQEQPRW